MSVQEPDGVPMNSRQRYLCSQLVELIHNSSGSPAQTVVNLEEIWQDGAVLESETPIQEGLEIELRCGPAFFAGRVINVEPHEFGWRFEIEFSAQTPWDSQAFQPAHLLNPAALGWKR